MEIPVLFADRHFVVLNKPAGLAVHPGPRGGPSVEDVFPTLSRRADGPWLAHRLDADTAGCLVVALRKSALLAAQAAFAAGTVRKTYWAVVLGGPAEERGVINAPLLKRNASTGWRMVVDPAGQRAETAFHVLGRGDGLTWLALTPRTGRTHQLRVHCAQAGFGIVGDPLYGTAAPTGLHLLAREITLPTEPLVRATAPPPLAMRALLSACGFEELDSVEGRRV